MKEGLKAFNIKFVSLPLGENKFDYQIDNSFFEIFDYHEFDEAQFQVNVNLIKKSTSLELHFMLNGTVGLQCDLTQLPYKQPVKATADLHVKFGDSFDDSDDEVLILPQGEHTLNVAQMIYETVVLHIPLKRIHPDVESGKIKPEIYGHKNLLTEDSESNNERDDEKTDPRWDKLKDLLN